jgi:hypothetical protein
MRSAAATLCWSPAAPSCDSGSMSKNKTYGPRPFRLTAHESLIWAASSTGSGGVTYWELRPTLLASSMGSIPGCAAESRDRRSESWPAIEVLRYDDFVQVEQEMAAAPAFPARGRRWATITSTSRVARPRPWPWTRVTQPPPCRARAAAGPPAGDVRVLRSRDGQKRPPG